MALLTDWLTECCPNPSTKSQRSWFINICWYKVGFSGVNILSRDPFGPRFRQKKIIWKSVKKQKSSAFHMSWISDILPKIFTPDWPRLSFHISAAAGIFDAGQNVAVLVLGRLTSTFGCPCEPDVHFLKVKIDIRKVILNMTSFCICSSLLNYGPI